MSKTFDETVAELELAAVQSDIAAEVCESHVAMFKDRYVRDSDPPWDLNYYQYVVTDDHQAKRMRSEAQTFRDVITLLKTQRLEISRLKSANREMNMELSGGYDSGC